MNVCQILVLMAANVSIELTDSDANVQEDTTMLDACPMLTSVLRIRAPTAAPARMVSTSSYATAFLVTEDNAVNAI